MLLTEVFNLRLRRQDRQRLRELAEASRRTESDVIRQLLHQARPAAVSTGLPPLTLHTEAPSEPERATAA